MYYVLLEINGMLVIFNLNKKSQALIYVDLVGVLLTLYLNPPSKFPALQRQWREWKGEVNNKTSSNFSSEKKSSKLMEKTKFVLNDDKMTKGRTD